MNQDSPRHPLSAAKPYTLSVGVRACAFVLVSALSSSVWAQSQEVKPSEKAPSTLSSTHPQSEGKSETSTTRNASDEKWILELTPYVWFTGVSGTLQPTAGGRSVEFDESFSDVLEDLNSAFFLAGYARKGRLVLLGDFSYVNLSQEGVVPPDIRARGSLRQFSLTLAVGYQAVVKKQNILDVLVGFRSWLLEPAVEAANGGIDASREKSFTDIVFATRRNVRISDDWSLLLYADFGVFRVGSNATRQFVGAVSYRADRDFFLSLGYRELSVDYRQNGARVDARLSGPIVGATWRF